MPAVTIMVFEDELTWCEAAELVDDVNVAVVPFVGEAVRSNVSLLVERVTSKKISSASYAYEPLLIGGSCYEPVA
jgi:phenylpyruvate tautomerase PptA (4-oxalocrotonate tautomerase family)